MFRAALITHKSPTPRFFLTEKNNLRRRRCYLQTLKAISDNKDAKQSKWNYNPSRPRGPRRGGAWLPRPPLFLERWGPRGPRALSSPRAPGPAGSRGRGASVAPPTIWPSLRRGSPRSSSRGVQNLSRPGVTRGTKTISGSGVLGPGPDGGGTGIRAEPPAQPLSEPGGPAGWGPEVTQRSRRDKRHPLALAPIPGAPRPLTSLRRPPRTPLAPPGQSFR